MPIDIDLKRPFDHVLAEAEQRFRPDELPETDPFNIQRCCRVLASNRLTVRRMVAGEARPAPAQHLDMIDDEITNIRVDTAGGPIDASLRELWYLGCHHADCLVCGQPGGALVHEHFLRRGRPGNTGEASRETLMTSPAEPGTPGRSSDPA